MGHAKQSSSEQKLKAVWELAGDAMVFLDADGLLDCNDAALRLFGIDSREHAIGLPLHAFAPPTQADGRPSAQVFADGRRRSSSRASNASIGISSARTAGRSCST